MANMRRTCAQTALLVAVLVTQCQQAACSNDARRRAPAAPVSAQDRIKRKTQQWQAGTREGGVGVGEGESADEEPAAQRPATGQDGDGSWRNKAAERLGLSRGAGQPAGRSSNTKPGAAETANALQCNVTLACHACPEASIRDRAEYCLPTRWRQQVRCLRLDVEVEVFYRFESCKNCTTLRCKSCVRCLQWTRAALICLHACFARLHAGLPVIDPNKRLSPSGFFLTHKRPAWRAGLGTGGTMVSEHTAVLQMEAFWALVFVVSWIWLQQRRRRRAPGSARAGSSADKKGAYVAMGSLPTTP